MMIKKISRVILKSLLVLNRLEHIYIIILFIFISQTNIKPHKKSLFIMNIELKSQFVVCQKEFGFFVYIDISKF